MSKRSLLLVAALASLSACTLGTDYRRPEAPVPLQWSEGKGTDAASLPELRVLLPEPRLRALIDLALAQNRDLRIATARIAEARALYGVQLADRLPNIDLSASRNAAYTPRDLSLSGAAGMAQRYDVSANLLSFELDFWGRVRSLNQAALANYLASEEAQRTFRLSLIADVANAYFGEREAEERLALTRASVASRSETAQLTDQRRRLGVVSDLDFLQASGALEAARADLANLERARAAATDLLNQLVGVVPEKLPPGRTLADQGVVFDFPVGLPADVLLRRPDVLAAEQRLIAAHANIAAARAAFLPRINLIGSVGTASRALSGLFDAGQGAWSFQPLLRLPLFDAGRNEAGLDLAQARREIAVADYERTIQQAFREVNDLLSARTQLALQLAAQEAGEKLQSERLRLTDARYKAGVSSYLEVLDAQRELYAVQQNVVQTRHILLASAAQLYKALGGDQAALATR